MRTCGSCTLCCKLLLITDLKKEAGTRCRHQRATGCSVMDEAARPKFCYDWSCRWLKGEADIGRPDRVGYVVDPRPDYVEVSYDGERRRMIAIQVWCDPGRPDAHRDPGLRKMLAEAAESGIVAVVRFSGTRSMGLFAPHFTGTDEWRETPTGVAKRDLTELDKMIAKRGFLLTVDKIALG